MLLLLSCNSSTTAKTEKSTIVKEEIKHTSNSLSMKINGKEWKADAEIFGAFHPEGYNKAIIIAGSKGPKDKNEQAFNINLYNTNGPDVFTIKNGNTDNNVIQLANLSQQNYLYGSMMGFNVKINITKASKNPTIIEATFEGELTGNASDKLIITEGKFYYHE
jgi:hypothetical protein